MLLVVLHLLVMLQNVPVYSTRDAAQLNFSKDIANNMTTQNSFKSVLSTDAAKKAQEDEENER